MYCYYGFLSNGECKRLKAEENLPGAQNLANLWTEKFQKDCKEHLAASGLYFSSLNISLNNWRTFIKLQS